MRDGYAQTRVDAGVRARVLWLPALLALSLLPVAVLVWTAMRPVLRYPVLWGRNDGSLGEWSSAFVAGAMWRAMGSSLLLAALTGAIGCVVAYLAARTLSRASRTARSVGAALMFLPVIAPPIALGVGVQVSALRLGVGGTLLGVLAAHLVPACGYLTLFLLGVLDAHGRAIEDEAHTLGANGWQVLLRVTWPALRSQLLAAVVLGALVSWGQLALTLLVGGGVVRTLPVELLAYIRSGDDRLGAAAALLLSVPPVLALGVLQSGARRTGAVS